jgi:RNA polymerase sigma-70 factor (ECF subfamily)
VVNESANIDFIQECKKGSRKAQEALYKNYYRTMMTICIRYTKNEQDAVEVLNNGYLKVFRNIEKYNPAQASIYTWIRTIVINSCLDFIRSKQKLATHDEIINAEEAHVPAEVLSRLKAQELLALIRKLPPATQAVFNLYAIEGYNHREIGELLNISDGTSKWHVSEAKKSLQKMIATEKVNS